MGEVNKKVTELDAEKARQLIGWLNDHPMATREEIYLTWRSHGIRTDAQWYNIYPITQQVLRNEYDGLAIVHYQHRKPFKTWAGERTDFWFVSGDETYAREHVLRLVRHITTRANTIADDPKLVVMQRSADDATRKAAGDILDMAHHASSTKDRLELMEFGVGPKVSLSDADLILLRSWIERTPFIPHEAR